MRSVPEDYVYLDYAGYGPLCEEAAGHGTLARFPDANLAVEATPTRSTPRTRAAFKALEDARRSLAATARAGLTRS